MPLEIICAMMGVPASRYAEVVEATDIILAMTDPGQRVPAERIKESVIFFAELMSELGRQRREEPADDLITALVHADVDGESLSELELGAFFRLLVVAGNETTRNGLSHALMLLTGHPGQRDLLLGDLDARLPAAVEEVVRYATPVTWMRRTVKTDHELNGHRFRAGETVILHYASANRDEAVFDRPQDFDITRSPNPHVGFGGPGPHFCLGAHLARREITLLLRELFTRVPGIHAVGEADIGPNGLVNAVRHLRCAF
jgi:cytochrome P450